MAARGIASDASLELFGALEERFPDSLGRKLPPAMAAAPLGALEGLTEAELFASAPFALAAGPADLDGVADGGAEASRLEAAAGDCDVEPAAAGELAFGAAELFAGDAELTVDGGETELPDGLEAEAGAAVAVLVPAPAPHSSSTPQSSSAGAAGGVDLSAAGGTLNNDSSRFSAPVGNAEAAPAAFVEPGAAALFSLTFPAAPLISLSLLLNAYSPCSRCIQGSASLRSASRLQLREIGSKSIVSAQFFAESTGGST